MTVISPQEQALQEPIEDWLQLSTSVNVQIPNEIFEDLNTGDFKSWQHKAFAYTYYYINTWLYRNALYGQRDRNKYAQQVILKRMVNSTSKFTYITKKQGVLEKLGYLETIHDYPVDISLEEYFFDFCMYSELDSIIQSQTAPLRNFAVKKPTKAFVRHPDEENFTGTFYDFRNTHTIPTQAIVKILDSKTLSYIHFYLLGYIIMLADRHKGTIQLTNKEIQEFLGCGEKFVTKVTKELEQHKLVKSERRKGDTGFIYQKVYTPITGK